MAVGEPQRSFIAPNALYVHVPLCASKCSYCDFFSIPSARPSLALERTLVESTLARGAALSERFCAERFDTVYVGGGTPTVLSELALDRLLGGIESLVRGRSGGRATLEWTVEANPDSLRARSLEIMRNHGVTRLSIGVQSLDPRELEILGRRHGPDVALDAVRLSKKQGMSVSADLIAGIPALVGDRPPHEAGRLAAFARELVEAGATHLSVYDLSVEEGTPLAARNPELRFPDEEENWEKRQALEEYLSANGMRRYEVSNFARLGDECRHNLAYWRMDSYIGIGPGAVSTISEASGSLRIEEPRRIGGYGFEAAAVEKSIGLRDAAFETIMMAFRTSFGLDMASFEARFGVSARQLIGDTMKKWRDSLGPGEPWPGRGESGGPALNGRGLDLLNRYLVDCLVEIESKMPNMITGGSR